MGEPVMKVVPLSRVKVGPLNPRHALRHLDELMDSLRQHGLLQPVVVRPAADGDFELVAGHRRFAAAEALGWTEIPVSISTVDQDDAAVLMLVENLQRDDLTPREEADGLELLLRQRRWTTIQVAEAIKRSPAYVSKRLRVFEDELLGPLVLDNRLAVSSAEELLPLRAADKRRLAEAAVAGNWDHAQVRAAARAVFDSKNGRRGPGILRQTKELRASLQGLVPTDLSDAERQQLRLLFLDLAVVARAPVAASRLVFPALDAAPQPRQTRRRTTTRRAPRTSASTESS